MGDNRLRFLVVMAHPHDFTSVAGTCGIHAAAGDEVTWVSMTAGASTHNERLADELAKPEEEQDPKIVDQDPHEYMTQKTDELNAIADLFGVNGCRALPYPDKPFLVERNPEAVEKIRSIILEVRPHVILTQSPYLTGPQGMASGARNDHTETGFAVIEAKLLAQIPRYGTREAPHVVPATFFPGIYFEKNQWDFVVDIGGEFYEKRVEAEVLFKSQGHTAEYSRRRIDSTVGNTGYFAGITHGEAFVRERPEVVSKIRLSDYTLRRAVEPRLDMIRRQGGRAVGSKES